MRNNKGKSKRTEATLSLIVTSALVITLAIAVASAIRKGGSTEEHNNIVNLNETESGALSANNEKLNSNKTDNFSKINEADNSDTLTVEDVKNAVESETSDDEEIATQNDTAKTAESNDTSGDVPVAAPDSVSTSYSFSEADTLTMPVNGEIILSYNMDNTIWFPTLGVYKCNPGLYIGSAVGTDVTAAASGTVASITQDEELGNIVTIDMGNGYMASYGLLENINVAEGEVVLSGQPIGTVANPTVYYTTEGSGVYFKLTKNDAPENPLEYME